MWEIKICTFIYKIEDWQYIYFWGGWEFKITTLTISSTLFLFSIKNFSLLAEDKSIAIVSQELE